MIAPAKKQGFRKPSDFIAAAEDPPEQVVIDPVAGTVTITKPAPEPQEPAGDVIAAEPAQPVAPAKKKAPAKPKPWNAANPKLKITFGVRLPESLHMKLTWLSENVPNASMHSIALEAIEERISKMLTEHWKE